MGGDMERGAVRLVAEYHSRLLVDAKALCGDDAEAEDLVFRTFENVLRKIDTFRGECSFYGWMKTILENIHRSSRRRMSSTHTVYGEISEDIAEAGENPTSDERVLAASDAEVVRAAINGLSPSLRETIVLHYFMEQPIAKIARLLTIPEGTVKFRLHMARKVLAGVLAEKLQKPLVVAVVAGACLAAVAGVVGYVASRGESGGSGESQLVESPVGAQERVHSPMLDEIDVISQQGENMMIARKMAGVVGAAVVSVAVSAAELTSEPTLVFTRPETSSFWNTATNNVMTVPIDFPSGATTATLTVSGLGYSATYANIEKGTDSYTFTLPPAVSPQTENVYDLLLAFNDGTERKAKLGLIDGLSPNAEGTTRCLAPADGRVWGRVKGKAVLPIPYGTTSFSVTVNGEQHAADTGLNGAQGWYALGVKPGDDVSLSMIANGLSYSASLHGALGIMLIVE